MNKVLSTLTVAVITSFSTPIFASQNLTFTDVFDFKTAQNTQLTEDGRFLALSATPYRGDPKGLLYDLNSNKTLASIENGTKPQFSKNGLWVAFIAKPDLLTSESATKKEKKKLRNNLALVNTQTKQQLRFDEVKDFQLSDDGQWLAFRQDKPDEKTEKEDNDSKDDYELSAVDSETAPKSAIKPDKKDTALPLKIIKLATAQEQLFDGVLSYDFAHQSAGMLISQVYKDGAQNAISYLSLAKSISQSPIMTEPGISATKISWHPNENTVAFYAGNYVNNDARRRSHQLYLWQQPSNRLTTINSNNEQWFTGKTAKLEWSEQGERLYFENRPALDAKIADKKYKTTEDLRDFDTIRAHKGLKVWHHQNPQIKTREQIQWNEENKYRHYQAVYHYNSRNVVQLSTPEIEDLKIHTEKSFLLGSSNTPYLNKVMYDGFYADYYAIDVATGNSKLIVKQSRETPTLAPNGQYAAYFLDGAVQLKNLTTNQTKPLTQAIKAVFADDQHDYPTPTPGYGFAGWLADSSAVLVYSKFDIWAFDVSTMQATRLTQGAETKTQYRAVTLDKRQVGIDPKQPLFLSAHNTVNKETAVATFDFTTSTVKTTLKGKQRFDLVDKAKNSDRLLFTKQSYQQFPDLWQTDVSFKKPKKVTNLNPQLKNFAWGAQPELVQYKGYDGEDLQGVLIKPAGYKKGDKVPVVVYFYRYMSQRMYDFPAMELNHRPNLPMFTSNGYAIFLPDIRFEIGHPGKSSTQTMINAAQKLIDIGVAHPDKIGLQGHSWAGYQSAFMITQTDMFKAVVSGAPVSNMTSAYSGIRLKSGLARQFQYETGQSRIGKNLFEARDLYIENSPVFFADKVNTPILIMFGDKDDAVPWHEGVQYYLALRRAQKDVIFLQYEGEPHHLKKFPNQVDFSIRMMEYFDHHLKGLPAPQWMTQGEAFIEE
ncbi:alpha/beta hydrolase family protein [Pseudoalteromonas tunicata]|uniref:Peptidase S9 prolyl oligopeptidase catalytic domain-containing protein n=1 Tax=Pseudoalteromonas tunicata D2 TaxID=87626 RepID=A4C8X1_9GAMM|nr:prolyl oligopeptidase family serine peptidase [Pseudoalteromonas tunicata]ATC93539.1 hypothetical protein PTUN_a0812 [Pseudoalteromonas tunicata]AXT29382.1 S9 family peptidase [Pseudoalteromonas tunicata]EAR29036.1 hypothetical protein PTD2_08329 [Pseudoalteromonas tunicata D2]